MFAAFQNIVTALTTPNQTNEQSKVADSTPYQTISTEPNPTIRPCEPSEPASVDQSDTIQADSSLTDPPHKPVAPSVPTSTSIVPKLSAHSPLPDDADGIPWMTDLRIRECFVYPIQPSHHDLTALYAEAFQLDKPINTGELQVMCKNDWLYLRLLDSTGAVFADSTWLDCVHVDRPTPLSHFIQPVKDSSRYFGLRVGDPGPKPKRVAHVLIGFRERPSAFDLLATINDRVKVSQRLELTQSLDSQDEREAEKRLQRSHIDLALKGTIQVKLNIKTATKFSDPAETDNTKSTYSETSTHKREPSIVFIQHEHGMILAPPPEPEAVEIEVPKPHKKTSKKRSTSQAIDASTNESATSSDAPRDNAQSAGGSSAPVYEEDEWGDWAGAT